MNAEEALKELGEWYAGFADKPSEEAIKIVMDATEKQIPKPIEQHLLFPLETIKTETMFFKCECGGYVRLFAKYCGECGKKLDY